MKTGAARRLEVYLQSAALFVLFIACGLVQEGPRAMLQGFWDIQKSRGVLGTDFIFVGGIGGAMLNAAAMGVLCLLCLALLRVAPCGAALGGIWMTVGFSFFGATPFNTLPVMAGVCLACLVRKRPLQKYYLPLLLASTLGPVTSDIFWAGRFTAGANAVAGIAAGVAAGALLVTIVGIAPRLHKGYSLYNVGFSGGVVAVLLTALRTATGYQVVLVPVAAFGNNRVILPLLLLCFVFWMLPALLRRTRGTSLRALPALCSEPGRGPVDFYGGWGDTCMINMGLLGLLGTAVAFLLGGELSGSVLAAIFSMMGFGAMGKQVKTALPVMAGALLVGLLDPGGIAAPSTLCAVLFATSLCPVAGGYGVVWGVLAGAMHQAIVGPVNLLAGGLNLFSNGFAAGWVAIVVCRLAPALRRAQPEDA